MLEPFDTAVFVPGRGLYAFADDLVWRFGDGLRLPDPGFPRPITAEFPGAFARALDAAVVHPDGGLYLFRGDQHIRYDVARRRPAPGHPRRYARDWPGVFDDGGIDAAVAWAPDIVYVFSGDRYTSFSPLRARVRSGFPKPIAGNWPGLDSGPLRAALALPGGRLVLIGPTRTMAYDRDGNPRAQEFELALRTGPANGAAGDPGAPALRSRRFPESPVRADLEAVASTKATGPDRATGYLAPEWAAAADIREHEGAAARGERWAIETYEPGRADLQPCDGAVRVA